MSGWKDGNNKVLSVFFRGNFIAHGYYHNSELFNGNIVTLTIQPDLDNVNIEFDIPQGSASVELASNIIQVRSGTEITYTVTKQHYREVTDTITLTSSLVIPITMELDKRINVADYTYTTDENKNVVLTSYIGSDTDVTVPLPEFM